MPMFGSATRKPISYSTPGIGDGLPGATPPAQQPGFFDAGGTGRTLAGILGDALASLGGQQGVYAQTMLQNRQQEREDQRWQKRFDMQAALKAQKTPNPTPGERYADVLGLTGAERLKFIRSFAFKPTLLQVPNIQGGTDYTEYDPSSTGGLPSGYNPDEWEVVE